MTCVKSLFQGMQVNPARGNFDPGQTSSAMKHNFAKTLTYSYWCVLITLLCTSIASAQIPTITDFSPKVAVAGSAVTITGANFSATPSENIVQFGPARAEVVSATATTLIVKVPMTATYKPISVNTGGLVAYSLQLFTPTFEGGELFFNPKVEYTVRNNPRSVDLADFNNDGHLDLVVCNVDVNNLSILPGDGTGKLLDPIDFTIGSGGSSVSADFSGDGFPDLAAANYSGSNPATASILINTGPYAFAPESNYFLSNAPVGIGSGAVFIVEHDFNKDGHLDIAFPIDNIPGSISVLLNQGEGTFASKTEYPVTHYPYSVAAGDFDRDGYPDLAVANFFTQTMSILMNDKAGGFLVEITYPAENGSHDVEVADFNRDGSLDVAIVNALSNTVNIFTNDGSGNFSPYESFPSGSTYQHCLTLADLNGDGTLDISAGASGTSIYVMLGKAAGGFDPPVELTTGNVPASIAIGDLDEDGRPDIVTGNFTDHTVSVLLSKRIGEPPVVAPELDLVVYNAISPNGDQKNDFFFLENIDRKAETRENVVTIYNRWGDEVWRGANYDNASVVFDGTSENGKQLPAGTYFYRIQLNSGKDKTGYLSIKP
jgi:gliding motility-associated-like protein